MRARPARLFEFHIEGVGQVDELVLSVAGKFVNEEQVCQLVLREFYKVSIYRGVEELFFKMGFAL